VDRDVPRALEGVVAERERRAELAEPVGVDRDLHARALATVATQRIERGGSRTATSSPTT